MTNRIIILLPRSCLTLMLVSALFLNTQIDPLNFSKKPLFPNEKE